MPAPNDQKGITAKKLTNFSEWFTEVIQKCELADIRYNVKGFLVFQPWSVLAMEKMYHHLEVALQRNGHKPYWFPTVIPEGNLKRESDHVKGFTPEVFWITEAGSGKLEERLALRPTSETAFHQMFSLWIRSYKDLPFKAYQRASVFRHETKATRPFLRSREFHWIETHVAHESLDSAEKQVRQDMEMTYEILHDKFGLPFIFFERPAWDKFPGAHRTFAADVLNPDGRVVQQPSTHILKQDFSKGFDVKFKDKDGKDNYCWLTTYGPAVSRIFASVIITHGDDKGLRFPWEIAPVQVAIVPVVEDANVLAKCNGIKDELEENWRVEMDLTEKSAGEKFNYWEMKGVPVRIDVGLKDLDKKQLTVFRRDLNKKETIAETEILAYVGKVSKEITKNLIKEADKVFEGRIESVSDKEELRSAIEHGKIARGNLCSTEMEGVECAEAIEKEAGATVRGTKLDQEKASGNCIICGKKASKVVYIARQY